MEIRTCTSADRAELRSLFGRAGESAPTETLWGHPDSEADVYLYPYLEHGTVLAAAVSGRFVGYLAGASGAFPSEEERMTRAIKGHRLMLRRAPLAFFARSMVDVAGGALRRLPTAGEPADDRWPAHLHINVAPEARGTGAADALVKEWLALLGETGCYLQTLRENVRAVRFFERMGFTGHGPEPLVPGVRYLGRRVHQKTMVRP
jgi:ribosomal protein S18 acetylase RimI-like enzyme